MNNKKVGIVTFNTQYNFGSALQVTALQNAVEKLGYTCEVLNYYYEHDMKQYDIRFSIKSPHVTVFDLLTLTNCRKRKSAYKKYQKLYLNFSEQTTDWRELSDISKECDCLICGSDQIWNFNITEGVNPAYFLKFANSNQKKISYAPSVGLDTIPAHLLNDIKEALQDFKAISTREENTAEQLSNILGRDVMCVLDPTLLFKSSFYDKLYSDYSLNLPKKYIFIYSIHVSSLKTLKYFAEKYAQENDTEIVYFNKYDLHGKLYKKNIFRCDLRSFVYTIKNADFVISDSFHACVFSILYNKQFAVYTGKVSSGNSRMSSLFSQIGIGDRNVNGEYKTLDNISYDNVDLKLENLRKLSWEYLEQSLK